jgi:hypothetical protein
MLKVGEERRRGEEDGEQYTMTVDQSKVLWRLRRGKRM